MPFPSNVSSVESTDCSDYCPVVWPRAIVLVDMNAFFASIEQRDRPEWRGRPVAITNGHQGTCIITCSYEARAYGIKTGMRLREARRLCPELIQCPAHPERYAATSAAIMAVLQDVTPDIEVFSVDEAFLDVTHCQRLLGTPLRMARLAKRKVFEVSGVLCSVGVSGDKTTAKFAAKLDKPDGLTVIPPWEAAARLRDVPVTELCGIAGGIGGFLAEHGVRTCGDMKRLPISVLARRFGNPGRRIWYMCQGADPEQSAARGAGAQIPRPWQGGAAGHPRSGGIADLPAAHEREGRRAPAAPPAAGDDLFHRPAHGRRLGGRQAALRPAHR